MELRSPSAGTEMKALLESKIQQGEMGIEGFKDCLANYESEMQQQLMEMRG